MKLLRTVFLALLLLSGHLHCETESDAARFMRDINIQSIPLVHEYAAIHAGFSFVFSGQYFPMLMINIPFGGAYHAYGGLGVSRDAVFGTARTGIRLGIGLRDQFPNRQDLFYTINASVHHDRSADYRAMTVRGEGLLEQRINTISAGVGLVLSLQSQEIYSSDVYPSMDERVYVLTPMLLLRVPHLQIHMTGTPRALAAGISWAFNLED